MPGRSPKLAVVGLDSADKDVVRQYVAEGYMPNVGALLEESIVGETRNPYGLESGSVWPTVHTGVDPSRHGQHEAVRLFNPSTYGYQFIDNDTVYPGNYWDHVTEHGGRCLLIDIPYAPPPEKLNGKAIWDWGTHIDCHGATQIELKTYPAELAEDVLTRFGGDPLNGQICDNLRPKSEEAVASFRDGLLERIETRTTMLAHYLAEDDYDYVEVVFSETHCIGHHCWHLHDPNHPDYDEGMQARIGNPMRDVYAAIDTQVGKIREALGPETTLMILFSHGMGVDFSGTHLLDRMLTSLDGRKVISHRHPAIEAARHAWRKLPQPIRSGLKPMQRKAWNAMYADGFQPGRENRRFFEVYNNHRSGGVRINLQGREAKGIVAPADYEATLDELEAELMKFVNDETGEPLVVECVRIRDHYDGDRRDSLPDLAVTWNRSAPINKVSSPKSGPIVHEHLLTRTGDHRPDGLFCMAGPALAPRILNEPVKAEDFVPTFARLMELPAPFSTGHAIESIVPGASSESEGEVGQRQRLSA